ncbi:MAG: hypothetical protein ACRYFX_30380, partial [Janthinobacterium lividum]
MQKTLTCLLGAVGCLLGLALPASAQTTYVIAPLTAASYTQDIIVEGTGAANTRASSDMDNGAVNIRYCYVAAGYVNPAGLSPTTGLPAGGLLTSAVAATPGLSFQLAAYGPPAGSTVTTSNNSLRLTSTTPTGTLTLATPTPAGYVYLLNASGNAPGNISNFSATVNFTDGSTQAFTSIVSPDWFGGTPYVINGLGRVNYDNNALDNNTVDPRMYQSTLALSTANYSKTIQSITITRTGAGGALNVMAVSLGLVCPTAPAAGSAQASPASVCPGSSTTLLLLGPAVGANLSYQWQQSTNGGVTFTNIAGATGPTYTATPTVTTQYRAVVTCGTLSSTSTAVTVTVLPTTTTLSYTASGLAATYCKTSGPQAVVTATPAGG